VKLAALFSGMEMLPSGWVIVAVMVKLLCYGEHARHATDTSVVVPRMKLATYIEPATVHGRHRTSQTGHGGAGKNGKRS
jgi:hypothetical protein